MLTIIGEHDLHTAPDLRAELDELTSGSGVVVDLSPATFVDSSVLGVILDVRRRAAEQGHGFAVAHADGAEAVGRVLDVTGLRKELPVHEDVEHAAEQARGGEGSGE